MMLHFWYQDFAVMKNWDNVKFVCYSDNTKISKRNNCCLNNTTLPSWKVGRRMAIVFN